MEPWPWQQRADLEAEPQMGEMTISQPCAPKQIMPQQMMPRQAQPQQGVSIAAKPTKKNSAEIWSQLIDALRSQPQQAQPQQSVPKPIVQGQFAERLEQLRSAMQARIKQAPALEIAEPPEEPLFNHTPALEIAEPPEQPLFNHTPALEIAEPPEQPLFNHTPALEIAEPPTEQLFRYTPPQSGSASNADWGSPVNDAEMDAIKAYEAL